MPSHRQRATVHETRVAMIAICLASLALLLVLIAYVGGLVNRVVVEYVHDADAAALVAIASTHVTRG